MSSGKKVRAIMGADSRGGSQRICDSDGEGWHHQRGDLVEGEPPDLGGLLSRCGRPRYEAAPKGQGNDALAHVLVYADELFRLDVNRRLFEDFSAEPVGDRLVMFEDTSRQLPMTIVAPTDG